ncbi:hypothetical protein [Nonomuraea sp. NPDC049480]|uniref:hypothetical protein n=1 Tax=Nonomuraea sp. NPDC049480 TaxID=3364353 RepID=UPI0037BE1F57
MWSGPGGKAGADGILRTRLPEGAGIAGVPLMLFPFLSSAFVPIVETLGGLLTGTPSAGSAIMAIAWCVGLALVGYLWARATFMKRA